MMRTKLKKLLSLLLIACMLLSIPPLWAIEAHAVDHSSADSRSIDGFSVGNNGTFVIAALVDGVYYAMSNTISGKITGTAIRVTNGCVSPQDATGYTFTFIYSNGVYTIQNDTQYLKYASSTNLGSSTTAYYWTITSGDNGSWRMISETDSRGLVFRAKTYNQFGAYALSNVKVGSAEYFDMEILPVTTACSHSYQYSSNGNGTHIVKCNKCNYSSVEDCSITGGKCSFCGWAQPSTDQQTYQLITSANQIADGKYVLIVAPGGTKPTNFPYYGMTRQMHGTSYIMGQGLEFSSVPGSLSVSNDLMVWNLKGNANSFTLTGSDGKALYHSSNELYYGEEVATSWTASSVNGTFTIQADTRYLGLRDDLATVDSNGNPCFRCNSSAKTTSYQFYMFKLDGGTNPECEHNVTYIEGLAAGCVTQGRLPHYKCTLCNRLFRDPLCRDELAPSDIIESAIGHQLRAIGGIEATCGSDGMMAHYECYSCDSYFLDQAGTKEVTLIQLTIPALGHDLIETPATPASCAREGNIAYYTCDICNAIFSDKACQNQIHLIDTIIPSLNHTLTYSPVVEATCTKSGVYAYYYCKVCDIYYTDDDYTDTMSKENLMIPALGHDIQFTNRMEPSCTEHGYIAHYYCDRCELLFADAQGKTTLKESDILIQALGHNYSVTVIQPSCTTDGRNEYTCKVCGDFYSTAIPATGHNYVNGNCVNCGEGSAAVDSSIVINHNLNLASDISINFAVKTSLLTNYQSYYLECRIPVYNGNNQDGYRTVQVQPVLNGSYYYFTLTGITAIQIGDEIQAVLHMNRNGTEYLSPIDYYSVAKYAYAQLNKTSTKESLNRLCANLLQYGAAAQIFKNYRTNALADASMTASHRAYLTDLETIHFTNHNRTLSDLTNPTVIWQGKSLILDSKITVKYIINTANFKGDVQNLTLRVKYTDYSGKSRTVTLTNPQAYGTTAGWYSFDFDGLLAAELRQVLSAAVYDGNTRVSQTQEYSVQSYGCNRTGTLLALCKAMIAYSDTALAYFNS